MADESDVLKHSLRNEAYFKWDYWKHPEIDALHQFQSASRLLWCFNHKIVEKKAVHRRCSAYWT